MQLEEFDSFCQGGENAFIILQLVPENKFLPDYVLMQISLFLPLCYY